MDIINPGLHAYLSDLAAGSDPVLQEMEAFAKRERFPIVGPQVGRVLFLLARAMGAKKIIELGSGFGYSAHWFARAAGEDCRVILTDGSSVRLAQAEAFLGRAGLVDRVQLEQGDALEIIDRIGGQFDIVFNDIDKHAYPDAYPRAVKHVRPGGLFISDNMLWSGRVAEASDTEASTEGVRALTRLLFEGGHFESAMLPIRDGVTVSVRV